MIFIGIMRNHSQNAPLLNSRITQEQKNVEIFFLIILGKLQAFTIGTQKFFVNFFLGHEKPPK